MLKRLARSAFAQALAARLLAAYLALVFRTSRWTLLGVPHAEAAVARGGVASPAACCFAHSFDDLTTLNQLKY